MKRKILLLPLLICTLLLSITASAQFRKKEKIVHLGIGTNPVFLKAGFPFTAAFEYGFSKWISGGAGLDLIVSRVNIGSYSYSVIGICPAARLSIHLAQIDVDWLDIYFGATLGQNTFLTTVDQSDLPDDVKNRPYFAGYFGSHFTIKKAFGLFGEVSAGSGLTSYARLGIALTIGGDRE